MQLSRRHGTVTRLALAALVAVWCLLSGAHAQEPQYSEDEIKAAFLFHFGTYVDWGTPPEPDDPITIAVLGARGVVAQLERFLPDRSIQNRRVTVRAIDDIRALRDEEILFIGREHNGRLRALIESVGRRRTLIVSDAEDGLEQGAMVNFQLVDQRLRFEVSLPAAQNAGLELSSRLLSAALRVETVDCRLDCHRLTPSRMLADSDRRALRAGRRRPT